MQFLPSNSRSCHRFFFSLISSWSRSCFWKCRPTEYSSVGYLRTFVYAVPFGMLFSQFFILILTTIKTQPQCPFMIFLITNLWNPTASFPYHYYYCNYFIIVMNIFFSSPDCLVGRQYMSLTHEGIRVLNTVPRMNIWHFS